MNMEDKMSVLPSICASIYNWLTPTVLFFVLNLTIGVIALTSNFPPKKTSDHRKNHLIFVGKSPFHIHMLKSADPTPLMSSASTSADAYPSDTATHFDINHQNYQFQRETEALFVETEQTIEETHASFRKMEKTGDTDGGKKEREASKKELRKSLDEISDRLKREAEFAEKPPPPPAGPRKTGDMKSGYAQLEEKEGVEEEDDDGVDAKADDFINKFKEQLKLQRIESWRKSNGWVISGM